MLVYIIIEIHASENSEFDHYANYWKLYYVKCFIQQVS